MVSAQAVSRGAKVAEPTADELGKHDRLNTAAIIFGS